MEEWRQVYGYEGLYIISSEGRIQSSYRPGRDRKTKLTADGYRFIMLYKDGKETPKTVHRLLMKSFYGDRQGLEVNHKNCNKLDNRLENLEYITGAENRAHAKANNLYARGERAGRVKLTTALVKQIYEAEGTNRALAKVFGIGKSQIQRIKAKETWCHVF